MHSKDQINTAKREKAENHRIALRMPPLLPGSSPPNISISCRESHASQVFLANKAHGPSESLDTKYKIACGHEVRKGKNEADIYMSL